MFMSLHESVILCLFLVVILSILWKWGKSILMTINLEMLTVIVISSFYSNVIVSSMLMFMLVFFVGEALIILSALYSSMNYSGSVNSSMIFY